MTQRGSIATFADARLDVARTLDAIQERITPSNVVNRTMESVAATTKLRASWGTKPVQQPRISRTAAECAARAFDARGPPGTPAPRCCSESRPPGRTGALMGKASPDTAPTPPSRKPSDTEIRPTARFSRLAGATTRIRSRPAAGNHLVRTQPPPTVCRRSVREVRRRA